MRNICLTISYDGSRYNGWQTQKGEQKEKTIQGKLEAILEKQAGEEVKVIGSGRTDAGVHAKGQVANFWWPKGESARELKDMLNRYLPEDICIREAIEVPKDFHSRFHAVSKTYEYVVYTGKDKPIFDRKYVWQPDRLQRFEVESMREAAAYLIGEHDFKAFCGNKKFKKSSVRTITKITIEPEGETLRFTFTGNGFLQNMVRLMTGTLLSVGNGELAAGQVKEILDAKELSNAGFMAPAKGLTLKAVEYDAMRRNKDGC